MKSRASYLLLITVGISLTVVIVSSLTADKTRFKNDFVRILPPHAAEVYKVVKVGGRRISIAGIVNQAVYVQTDDGLLEISLDLSEICWIDVENIGGHDLTIDSPSFYLKNGASAHLLRGSTGTWNIDTIYSEFPGYLAIQPISKNSFVSQTIDQKAHKSVFIKSNMPGSQKDILTKQVDGVICTDGFFDYSSDRHILVYTYRYRNQFLCIDTSLNVLRIGNTIDTTSKARLSVSEVDGKLTMSSPPFTVNRATCVDGRNLFVNSNLVAQNESAEISANRSIIDVYDILDGSYRFSFYLFNQDQTRLLSFTVRDTILIAIFPNHLVRYNLAGKYLGH